MLIFCEIKVLLLASAGFVWERNTVGWMQWRWSKQSHRVMCNNVWCVEVLREYKSSPFNKYSTCEMFVRIRCCVFLSWLMSLCCCNARPHETSRRCYGSQMVVACASCSWICSGTWCYPVATLFGINASQFICTSLTFIWFLEILSSGGPDPRSWEEFFFLKEVGNSTWFYENNER